jgi:hypothetical protein
VVPATDFRGAAMADLAARLRQAGLDSIKSEHYQGGHWLGTFAVYLVTRRGLK